MGGLFSKPKMPPVTPPARMPVQGDQATEASKRRKREELRKMQGRESTELKLDSETSNKLGE